ncbi:MAG: hypothetical protein ACHQQS_09650 [Thermoanaerobaculales bacterium]
MSATSGSHLVRENLRFFIVSFLVLSVGVLAVYWEALRYPFIQDDWSMLSRATESSFGEWLRFAFYPPHQLFYRPLGMTYFFLYERAFGLNPLFFHLINLTVHVMNSVLVLFIALLVSRSRTIALAVAVLYATAATIHLDPLLWMVGIFDLMGAFFFFSGLALLMSGKPRWSGLSFLLGLLFKESVIALPVVLLGWLFWEREKNTRPSAGIVADLGPHLAALALYLPLKLSGLSPFAFPSGFPYHLTFLGVGVVRNGLDYAACSLGALVPFLSTKPVVGVFAGVALATLALFTRMRRADGLPVHWAFLSLWAVAGIAVALPLANHWYRYYLTYSFPAVLLIALLVLRQFHRAIQGGGRSSAALVASWLLVQTLSAGAYVFRKDQAGIGDKYERGTNNLVHRGHAVAAVLDYLARAHPWVPDDTVFVVSGAEIEAFDGASAFRAFYRERGITAYPRATVEVSAGGKMSLSPLAPGADQLANRTLDDRSVILLDVGPEGVKERVVSPR